MSNIRMFFCSFFMTLTWISPVYAYVDPGTGSMIWQVLLAGFFGFMFYISKIRKWIIGKFRRDRND